MPLYRMHEPQLLTLLRRETSERHSRLEQSLQLQLRLETGRSDSYAGFLQGTLIALERLEELSRWLPGLGIEARCAALRSDLAALGPRRAPRFELAPLRSNDLSEAFGHAYVVEGSALGAVVIAKQVRLALPDAPRSYLEFHAAELRDRWLRFVDALRSHDGSLDDEARLRLCTAACAAFDHYASAFRAVGMLHDA